MLLAEPNAGHPPPATRRILSVRPHPLQKLRPRNRILHYFAWIGRHPDRRHPSSCLFRELEAGSGSFGDADVECTVRNAEEKPEDLSTNLRRKDLCENVHGLRLYHTTVWFCHTNAGHGRQVWQFIKSTKYLLRLAWEFNVSLILHL